MKRVLTILAILLLPLSVWAMTPVSDSDLSNVTGQAGVNINADVTMNVSIGTMAWGDADGVQGYYEPWPTYTDGGYVGVNNFSISNLQIKARANSADNYNHYSTLFLKPITIDVATGNGGAGQQTWLNGVTFVRFGLGALEISMNQLQFDVSLASRTQLNTNGTLDQNLGQVTLGAMIFDINPWSYVDIYNGRTAGLSGVTFDVAITLDRVKLPYMSWGDKDGIEGAYYQASSDPNYWVNSGSTPGFIGLRNFVLGDANSPAVTINGSVAIDILTSAHGIYSDLGGLFALVPHATSEAAILAELGPLATVGNEAMSLVFQQVLTSLTTLNSTQVAGLYATVAPTTVVHISFPHQDMLVNVAKMTGNVVLANASDLGYVTTVGSNATILGDIYIQGLGLTVKSGSWVDIWAH
jgi:hypothetical protein